MKTAYDFMITKPYPKIGQLTGKALKRRKQCLTKPVEYDTIKRKIR